MTHYKPLISVALCTYNGQRYLPEQLESLVQQTYPNKEIIICDDHSTDSTWAIVQDYIATYPFISGFRNEENLGFVKNFEKAMRLCNGKYIALCDQDDIWNEHKLSILQENIEDYDLIFHDCMFIDDLGNPIENKKMTDHYGIYGGPSNLPFLVANCVPGHAMLFKCSLLKYIDTFDKEYYHDWWLIFIAATVGRIKPIPDVLVKYRQHQWSITDSLSLKSAPEKKTYQLPVFFELSWVKHCAEFNNPKNSKEVKKIYAMLASYMDGKRGLKLFFFFTRYYTILFHFQKRKKSLLSNLNFIRKITLGRRILTE